MSNRSRNQGHLTFAALPADQDIPLHVALREFGTAVYAIRMSDGTIKIGHSTNVADRRHKIGPVKTLRILALQTGTRDDEMAIHARLVPYRAYGREYYRPTREVLAVVNEMRASVGVRPL